MSSLLKAVCFTHVATRQAQQKQQQMRSQFGNNNLSRNAPQHFSNQRGASAVAGSFDWSSTPAEGMPWGGRGGSAAMSQASAQTWSDVDEAKARRKQTAKQKQCR